MAETQKLTNRVKLGTLLAKPLTIPGHWLNSIRRNPIILKELRGRMRSWRTLFTVSLYVGLLSIFAVLTYAITMPRPNYNGYSNYYYNEGYERLGTDIFSAVIAVQLILIALLAPGFTSGVLSGEKERQTYEILLLTLLRPAEIVFGKLFSTLLYLFLLIIAALPVESIVFLVGGVGIDQLLIGLAVPVMTALLLGSLGIAWSSILSTSGRASRAAYVTGAIMFLGLPALGLPLKVLFYGFDGGSDSDYFLLNWASAFNPGVAVVATNEILITQSGGFSFKVHNAFYYIRSNGDFYPMPWLVFLIMALALSILFIVIAIRFVKPLKTDGDLARKGKNKKKK